MNYFKKRFEAIQAARDEQAPGALSGVTGEGFAGQNEDPGFAGQQAGGFADQKGSGFSATMQGDNPNRQVMRDEYGWKMTGDQYEALNEDTAAFNKQINQYKTAATAKINQYRTKSQAEIAAEEARYATSSAELNTQAKQTQAELDKAKALLGGMPTQDKVFSDWYNQTKMRVTVFDNGAEQGTYMVPRSLVDGMYGQGIEGSYTGDGTFRVNARQQGRMQGQEMHDMLRTEFTQDRVKDEFWKNEDIQGGYATTVSNWNKANSQLTTAEKQYQANLDASRSNLSQFQTNISRSKQNLIAGIKSAELSRDTEVNKVSAARQGQLDAARTAFEERSALRQTAYKHLANMGSTTQGANNE